jgi:hypothetical protein
MESGKDNRKESSDTLVKGVAGTEISEEGTSLAFSALLRFNTVGQTDERKVCGR